MNVIQTGFTITYSFSLYAVFASDFKINGNIVFEEYCPPVPSAEVSLGGLDHQGRASSQKQAGPWRAAPRLWVQDLLLATPREAVLFAPVPGTVIGGMRPLLELSQLPTMWQLAQLLLASVSSLK